MRSKNKNDEGGRISSHDQSQPGINTSISNLRVVPCALDTSTVDIISMLPRAIPSRIDSARTVCNNMIRVVGIHFVLACFASGVASRCWAFVVPTAVPLRFLASLGSSDTKTQGPVVSRKNWGAMSELTASFLNSQVAKKEDDILPDAQTLAEVSWSKEPKMLSVVARDALQNQVNFSSMESVCT